MAYLPKVSVILTSFNHAKYLREAIDSVLNQTFDDFELIIWDDASVDESWKIIQSYSDRRIKVFRNEKQMRGVYGINKAISEVAMGEYIAIHHSDDVWEPEKLEKQVVFLDMNADIGAVFTNTKAIDEMGDPLLDEAHTYNLIFNQENRPRHQWLRRFFEMGNALCHPSVLIRKQCYGDCGLYRYGLAQLGDFDMWMRLCIKYEIHVLPEKLVRFRVRDNEENSSGNRPEVRSRLYFEFDLLLSNYLQISCKEDLLKIFPEAGVFCKNDESLSYGLARAMLEIKSFYSVVPFALKILFENLNDPVKKVNINFDVNQFIKFTGELDPLQVLFKEQQSEVICNQEAQIASSNHTVTDRKKLNDELRATNDELRATNDELRATNDELRATNDELRATIQMLYSSNSWRLTASLRYAGCVAKRARSFVSRIRGVVRGGGGVGNFVARGLNVYRREGAAGVKARLTFMGKAASPIEVHQSEYHYFSPRKPSNFDSTLLSLKQHPVFSIVVPTYNTPVALLSKVVESVRSQWYPYWELILCDDASTSVETKNSLVAISDPRITVLLQAENSGIAGATNSAVSRAQGDFIVLLDHDDELTADCLYELARCIDREDPDYIYSDEDKINSDGKFIDPHFKPDWSPDTMMSTMYVCHVSCIRRSLLESVGGLRSDYDGCQDWDLVLRLTEKTDRIAHIPKVLYHWRIIPGSTAADIGAKPYILEASQRVRKDALARRGLNGTVEPVSQAQGYFRVKYDIQGAPLISIIIPTRDNGVVLRRCIDSIIEKTSYKNFELLVLDNGSVEQGTLDYFEEIQQQNRITVIRHDAPFNFSELNNLGVSRARGDLLMFLNDDTEVLSDDWLQRMAGYAQLEHVGAVGAKLLYPEGQGIQHAGVINLEDGPRHAFLRQYADTPGYYMRNLLEYNWLAVTGACLMVERRKFEAVGAFDMTLPVAYNDIELCLRLREADFFNVVCQAVRLVHHESLSRGLDHLDEEKKRRLERDKHHFYSLHPKYFQYDPFYNPNLHPNGSNFELAL